MLCVGPLCAYNVLPETVLVGKGLELASQNGCPVQFEDKENNPIC
jgi:hypothetical protein